MTVQQLRELVRQFVDERRWQRFHNLKNLSMALAIEAAELMEHTQWLTTSEVEQGQPSERGEVIEELADVTCYALAIANVLEIDLATAVTEKMVKNRLKYPVEAALATPAGALPAAHTERPEGHKLPANE